MTQNTNLKIFNFMKNLMKTVIYTTVIIIVSILVLNACKKDNVTTIVTYPAKTRVYYIAAEEVIWDYAPQGNNVYMGMPFDSNDSVYAVNLPLGSTPHIGRKYLKARY